MRVEKEQKVEEDAIIADINIQSWVHIRTSKVRSLKNSSQSGVVVHSCHPSTKEAEAGGSQIQSQRELQSEILFQETKTFYIYFFILQCRPIKSECFKISQVMPQHVQD
jgi:hypothetical protein